MTQAISRLRSTKPLTVILAFLLVLALAAIAAVSAQTQTARADPPGIPVPSDAQRMAAALPVLPDWTPADEAAHPYKRNAFGSGWATQPTNCNTRIAVLARDVGPDLAHPQPGAGSAQVNCAGGGSITVTGIFGWYSHYDGTFTTDPSKVDIDHMVPLADAWRSGAWQWTDAQRKAFANDLTNAQLLAVSASANRSKGDKDPSHWLPPSDEWTCSYVGAYAAVKTVWKLGVDQEEHDAIVRTLAAC